MPSPIDQEGSWRAIERRLASTNEPRRRRMLATVVAHLKAEAALDLPGLLATLVPDPRYHLWFGGTDRGPKGVDEVTAFYRELVASRRGVFEFAVDRIVVDDDTVLTEGTFLTCYGAELARRTGFDVPDEGVYLCPIRSVVLWAFDGEGRMTGEDVYATFDPSAARRLSESEIPAAYRAIAGASA